MWIHETWSRKDFVSRIIPFHIYVQTTILSFTQDLHIWLISRIKSILWKSINILLNFSFCFPQKKRKSYGEEIMTELIFWGKLPFKYKGFFVLKSKRELHNTTLVDLNLWESVSVCIVSTHPLKNRENTGPLVLQVNLPQTTSYTHKPFSC